MISVTFDSNVWENVVDESKRIESSSYLKIYDWIVKKEIEPFFFEGIVTLETIPKLDRKQFLGSFKPSISIQVGDEEPNVSEGTAPPELSEYLKDMIPKAIGMGFKFLRFPRIGGHGIDADAEYAAKDTNFSLTERLNRSFEFARFVEELGAGKGKLNSDISQNLGIGFSEKIKNDTNLAKKQFAKNIAEWVDGDALAAHYGYGIDYFCTNDKASGAGSASVFSDVNLEKLIARYSIKVVPPDDLIRQLEQLT